MNLSGRLFCGVVLAAVAATFLIAAASGAVGKGGSTPELDIEAVAWGGAGTNGVTPDAIEPLAWGGAGTNGITPDAYAGEPITHIAPGETSAAAPSETQPLCDATAKDCILSPGWTQWLNASPETRKARTDLLSYAVRCALPADASVTVPGSATLRGWWGLRPEWQRAALNTDGQELVSACLLSSVNAYGEKVTIALAGPDIAFVPPPGFRHMEAAFFGNVFTRSPVKKVCRGTDSESASLADGGDKRICSTSAAACGLDVVGACEGNLKAGCTRWAGLAPHGYCAEAKDADGNTYRHPVTVYLRTQN